MLNDLGLSFAKVEPKFKMHNISDYELLKMKGDVVLSKNKTLTDILLD